MNVISGTVIVEECAVHCSGYGQATSVNIEESGTALVLNSTLSGCVLVIKGDALIQGCSIKGSRGSGLFFKGQGAHRPIVRECSICESKLACVAITEGGDPFITNCKIYAAKDVGVYIFNEGKGTLKRCEVTENKLGGVQVQDRSSPTIEDCLIHKGPGVGLFLLKGAGGVYRNCQLRGFKVSNLAADSNDTCPALINVEVASKSQAELSPEEEEKMMKQWRSTLSVVKNDDDALSAVTFEDRRVLEKHAPKF